MLVHVDLEHRAGLRAQVGGLLDDLAGCVLRDGDRQRGVDQRMPVPPPQVCRAAVAAGDDLGQYAPDTGFLRPLRDHPDVHGGTGPGVGDGGEAAPKSLQRGQLRRDVGALLVQRVFQRLPYRLEDLRGLSEGLGLAEALGQMVVRVHEAGHQQVAVQADRLKAGVRGDELWCRSDLAELSVLDEHGLVAHRPVRQQQQLGHQEVLSAVELFGPGGGFVVGAVGAVGALRGGHCRSAGASEARGAEEAACAGQARADEESPPSEGAASRRRFRPCFRPRLRRRFRPRFGFRVPVLGDVVILILLLGRSLLLVRQPARLLPVLRCVGVLFAGPSPGWPDLRTSAELEQGFRHAGCDGGEGRWRKSRGGPAKSWSWAACGAYEVA